MRQFKFEFDEEKNSFLLSGQFQNIFSEADVPFLCPLLISKRRNANNGREKVKAIKDIFHEDICQKHNWQKVLFFTLHKYNTEQVKNLESKALDHLMMETANEKKNLCWPQPSPFGIPRILSGISNFHYGFPSSFCLTDHLSKFTGF